MISQAQTEKGIELGKTYMLLDAANKREAALREEHAHTERREKLAKEEAHEHLSVVVDQRTKIDALQQRLTVAEQRTTALSNALSEVQWHHEPYDDFYHKESGYYCPTCGSEKSKGHDSSCEIAAALKPAEEGEGS